MAALEEVLRETLAGGRVNGVTVWPTTEGRWQANVRWKDTLGWTVEVDIDPVKALMAALRSTTRFTNPPAPRGTDKDARRAVEAVKNDFDDLI